jgi:GNAT superfamily N-acetyltransferase
MCSRFFTTIRQRGVLIAMRRTFSALWCDKRWTILNCDLRPIGTDTGQRGDGIVELECMSQSHLDDVISVWPREMPKYRNGQLRLVLEERFRKEWWGYIARVGPQLVGAVWLQCARRPAQGLNKWITPNTRIVVNLFVTRDFRGRGLSARLLRFATRDAALRGVTNLVSLVHPERIASLRVHKRVGFRCVGVMECHSRFWFETSRYQECSVDDGKCSLGDALTDEPQVH